MNTYSQIQFLKGVHFRSIAISIFSARQPFRTNKIDRQVRLAKKENYEADKWIKNYAETYPLELIMADELEKELLF